MKKIAKLVIMFTVILSSLSLATTANFASAATSYKAGDIFITKSTSSKGVAGHSAIAINSTTLLHTSGWKSEPYPKEISIKDFLKRYPKTKVIRPSSSTVGTKAAQNATKYFKGKKIPYEVTTNPTNIKKTYCSELVWYAYYKSGKTFKVFNPGSQVNTWITPSYIRPYDFSDQTNMSHNGFKWVDSKW